MKPIQNLEEKIIHLEHLLKVLIKGQQEIKRHLWGQEEKPQKPSEEDDIDLQEQEAVNYIHGVLIPDLAQKEAEKGDMVAQSAWIEWAAKPVVEYLKTQALIYIGKALVELKSQLIPLAVDIADWVLDQLENFLLKQYARSSEEQKKQFKEKVKEKFPNSRLLEKLS